MQIPKTLVLLVLNVVDGILEMTKKVHSILSPLICVENGWPSKYSTAKCKVPQ